MERRFRLSLWGILALGVLISAAIAAVTRGDPFDMESFRMVRDAMRPGFLDVYASFAHRGIVRWPYPPGFFPWVWAAGKIAAAGGPGFAFMLRVPVILADAAIAWIVQDHLGRMGRSDLDRLLAAALVALGPSFVAIAGYHGQFDAVAILPGVLGVSLWPRLQSPWRALLVGLLIGLGGALKTVPLLLVLAVLPTVRSRREAILLLAASAVPVLVAFAPFAVVGTLPPLHALNYHGLPGMGDLSLAVQPNLAAWILTGSNVRASSLTQLLSHHGTVLIVAGLLIVAVVGVRSRARPALMATVLWLAVYALGGNFFFQYLVWGLPFFLMAGYVRSVLALQIALIAPTLIVYLRPWHHVSIAIFYAVVMIAVWAIATWAFVWQSWRLAGPGASRVLAAQADDRHQKRGEEDLRADDHHRRGDERESFVA